MGDRDRNELRSTVPDHPDLESLGAEEQRVGGNRDRRGLPGKLEVNEDVGPGQQLSARIVDVHLDVQRAGGEVDCVGGPYEPALE